MHIIAGAIMILVGAGAVAYVQRSAAAFLAVGVLLIAIGIGLCMRSRAAGLVARIGIGAAVLVIVAIIVPGWFTSGAPSTDEGLVRYFQLLGFAVAAAVMAVLFSCSSGARPADRASGRSISCRSPAWPPRSPWA
jgi:hypothetical protein